MRFIDLFCGIGGFHFAAKTFGWECVFASDIDAYARKSYAANHNIEPAGDITQVPSSEIPDHDFLFGGFPCQPFSIIGKGHGTSDPRGQLFNEIVRILKDKKPRGFVLENVKRFSSIEGGQLLKNCIKELEYLGYTVEHKVLNALDFGLPQQRTRLVIVGVKNPVREWQWLNKTNHRQNLSDILDPHPPKGVFASEHIRKRRREAHTAPRSPMVWHENKSGNVSSHDYALTLRAGASYNYQLVDGIRRFTVNELLNLQGFPADSFKRVVSDAQIRKQAGNAVPVPMIREAIRSAINVL